MASKRSLFRRLKLRTVALTLATLIFAQAGALAAGADMPGTSGAAEDDLISRTILTEAGSIEVSTSCGDLSLPRSMSYQLSLKQSLDAEFTLITLEPGKSFSLRLGYDTPSIFTVDDDGLEQPAVYRGSFPDEPFFIRADGRELLVSPPVAYSTSGYGCVERETAPRLVLERRSDGWYLYTKCEEDSETVSSLWFFAADSLEGEDGYGWYAKCSVGLFDDTHLMLESGYYYLTSANHIPNGSNLYYRIAAPHIAVKLAESGEAVAHLLGVVMLDICLADLGEDGYVPTAPGVDWLMEDYGIQPGFFDTRFNTDFARALLTLGEWFGIDSFRSAALTIAESLASRIPASEDGNSFLPDYFNAPGAPEPDPPSHTSLNHQAAEAVLLFRAGMDEQALTLALALENTAPEWITSSGDLWYARSASGEYFGTDYPYLTYNDLLALRDELDARSVEHPGIDLLLESKLEWMEKNGVEYK